MTITVQEDLPEILASHGRWLREEANGKRADLRDADLSGADLRGADLRRVDLRYADLYRADLRGADLRGADLRRVDLSGANLSDANLRGADLRRVDLRYAKLNEADLRWAYLNDADLRWAYLNGAKLNGGKLGNRNWVFHVGPQGSHESMLMAIWSETIGLRWWVGCKLAITTKQFLEFVAATHGDNEHARAYRHTIAFVENHPDRRRIEGDWLVDACARDYALNGDVR